jgi:hypothetical protein
VLAADLQDHLMMASNDLERLHTLLADACDTLMQRFYNATEQIHALMDAHSSDGDDKRDSATYQSLMQQLGGAVTALQFQDITTQLLSNCRARVEMVDQLFETIGNEIVATPGRPPVREAVADLVSRVVAIEARNPVAQRQMSSGDIDLF